MSTDALASAPKSHAAVAICLHLRHAVSMGKLLERYFHPDRPERRPSGLDDLASLGAYIDSAWIRARILTDFLLPDAPSVRRGPAGVERTTIHRSLFTRRWAPSAEDELTQRLWIYRRQADQHVAHQLDRSDVSGGLLWQDLPLDLLATMEAFTKALENEGSVHAGTFRAEMTTSRLINEGPLGSTAPVPDEGAD